MTAARRCLRHLDSARDVWSKRQHVPPHTQTKLDLLQQRAGAGCLLRSPRAPTALTELPFASQ